MRKGDVVLVPFPFTDLSGHKVRPALILHTQPKGEDCIVAFISSVIRGSVGMYEISVAPSKENGLKTPSRIRLDKIATLEKKILVGELGTIHKKDQARINTILKKLFSI